MELHQLDGLGLLQEALGSISTVPIAPTQQSGYIKGARLRPGWLDYEQAVVDSGHLAKYSPPSWSVDVPGRRFGSVTSGKERRSWQRF